jgi:site-specific DNA recombinase
MHAAIYARVSVDNDKKSEDHKEDETDVAKSTKRQIEGARAFIDRQRWLLREEHIYEDKGVSGALFASRPQFQSMLRDAEAGAFQVVVFFDLDRFGRDHVRAAPAGRPRCHHVGLLHRPAD